MRHRKSRAYSQSKFRWSELLSWRSAVLLALLYGPAAAASAVDHKLEPKTNIVLETIPYEGLGYQLYIEQVYRQYPMIYSMHKAFYSGEGNWKEYKDSYGIEIEDAIDAIPGVSIAGIDVLHPAKTTAQQLLEWDREKFKEIQYHKMWSDRPGMRELAAWWARNAKDLKEFGSDLYQFAPPEKKEYFKTLNEIAYYMMGKGVSPYATNEQMKQVDPGVASQLDTLIKNVNIIKAQQSADEREQTLLELVATVKREQTALAHAADEEGRQRIREHLTRRWTQRLSPRRTALAQDRRDAKLEMLNANKQGQDAITRNDHVAARRAAHRVAEHKQQVERIRAAERLAEFEEGMKAAQVWSEVAAELIGFADPELARELSVLIDFSFGWAEAVGRLTVGDPSGMPGALQATRRLFDHMAGRPDGRAIMAARLRLLAENQGKMTKQLLRIESRLAAIGQDVEQLTNLVYIHDTLRHRRMSELRAALAGMERRLESSIARHGMNLARIASAEERRDLESIAAGTASLFHNWRQRTRWSELQACRNKARCSDGALAEYEEVRRLLGEVAHRIKGTPLMQERSVTALSSGEIEALLKGRLEDRVPYIRSLLVWVLDAAERSFGSIEKWGDEAQVNVSELVEGHAVWADPVRAGWLIKEYLNLARWLPQKNKDGDVIRDEHGSTICQAGRQLREETAAVRSLIPIAWRLYSQFNANAGWTVQQTLTRGLEKAKRHSDGSVRDAAKRLEVLDLERYEPYWLYKASERSTRRIGNEVLYQIPQYRKVQDFKAEPSHDQRKSREFLSPVPTWTHPLPGKEKCVDVNEVYEGCDLRKWARTEISKGQLASDAMCVFSYAEFVTLFWKKMIDDNKISCTEYHAQKRAKTKIENFHAGIYACPPEHRVKQLICTKTMKPRHSELRKDIERVQASVWDALSVMKPTWKTVALARLAFDTLVRWSVGERLETDEQFGPLRQFLAALPQGPSPTYGEGQPVWVKIATLADEVERGTIGASASDEAVKVARWAGTDEHTALRDYIEPAALTACRTEADIRVERVLNEWRARNALYAAGGWGEVDDKGTAMDKADGEMQIVSQTPPWLAMVRLAVDALPIPTGERGEASVLDDGWHGIPGEHWRDLASANGWKEEIHQKPTCVEIRKSPEQWLAKWWDQKRPDHEAQRGAIRVQGDAAVTEETAGQSSGADEGEVLTPKETWGRLYGLIRPPVPTGESRRKGPGWGNQSETFARLAIVQATPSLRVQGGCPALRQ